ncbi:hypothetical protein F383_07556 [Gossypium arboreum]|uniref:Uncharacterized protein n=1 Tax=Gossypium arboreum TaxID=29729 RepID=A0A0B0NZK8_GOSAR|nr:hypothetical protein F383_07556 [Gossypium arboreum]
MEINREYNPSNKRPSFFWIPTPI